MKVGGFVWHTLNIWENDDVVCSAHEIEANFSDRRLPQGEGGARGQQKGKGRPRARGAHEEAGGQERLLQDSRSEEVRCK